jgi:hypothetical protein
MQIEQIIAGVNGDPTAQAIQLRMRSNGQEHVDVARLLVRDAAGANPIVLIDLSDSVSAGVTGARVLIESARFLEKTSPRAVPDAILTNLIPESYL